MKITNVLNFLNLSIYQICFGFVSYCINWFYKCIRLNQITKALGGNCLITLKYSY